jgi:hypothetical protein
LAAGIDALRKCAPKRPTGHDQCGDRVVVQATPHDKPINATHWSTRTLAAHLVLGATTICRVRRRNGLKPHLSRNFKLSHDPRFEDKLLDVVGLYMNPPEHALVLSSDEKSQIQALTGWGQGSQSSRHLDECTLPRRATCFSS